jgi:hypothetical protein
MDEVLKVKDNQDLVRHKQSNAILNTNLKELNKYKQEREEKMKLKKLIEQSDQMRTDIDEIKSLLRQLIGQK